ncbi:MAG: cysteine hydrolase [Nanoarchaeota archaeon]|nr:cysteine hydrolase [Nanoarchaeota archaeon]
MKQKTILVVDVQNEFCHPDGFFAMNKLTCNPEGFFGDGKLSVKSIDKVVDNIESAIAHFREESFPIAYVRGVGDPQYLSPSRFERYKEMYEQEFLKDGTNSTDFYRIKPIGEEPVFTKGGLDAFSDTQFREYVQRTASSLVLVGFFTDVCIDAIAMRAEERGIGIPTEIIADCTASLYWPQDKQLEKLKMLYGTKIHNSLSDYVSNSQNNSL